MGRNTKEIVSSTPIKGELYMGVEIECLLRGTSMAVELGRIRDVYGASIVGKHDGTVSHNVEGWMPPVQPTELVTNPMTLECYQNRKWTTVFDRVVKPNNFKTCTLGGHIHLSKAAFTRTQLYKYMKFVRTNTEYVKFIGGRDFNGNAYCKSHQGNGKVVRQLLEGDTNKDRYEVLNLTSFGTLENRFFLSPFTREELLKNLEWCHALWSYSKVSPLHIVTDAFHDWVRATKESTYSNLIAHINTSANMTFPTNGESFTAQIARVHHTFDNDDGSCNEDTWTCCCCSDEYSACEAGPYIVDGDAYCGDCCSYCERCEEYYTEDAHYLSGQHLCPSCYHEVAVHCDRCGSEFHRDGDDLTYVENEDRDLCESCMTVLNICWCDDCDEYTIHDGRNCTACTPDEDEDEDEECEQSEAA